jgi:hypothetical protein
VTCTGSNLRSGLRRPGHVLLPALHVGEVARQLFVLPRSAPGRRAALDLVLQVQQAAAQLSVLVGGASRCSSAVAWRTALLLHALAQVEDGAARLVVLEQRRLRGAGEQQGGARQRHAAGRVASSSVGDLGAAVLRPGGFVGARRGRLFLAEAHGLDLAVAHAQQA